jgi:hypothetical protein
LTTAVSQPTNLPVVSRGLQLLSSAQLRELLREYSLPTGGNKLTLVNRLLIYLETFGTHQESLLVQFSVKLRKFLSIDNPSNPPDSPSDQSEAPLSDISELLFKTAPSCLYDLCEEPFIFGPVSIPAHWPSEILSIPGLEFEDDSLPFVDFAAVSQNSKLVKVIITINDEYVVLNSKALLHPLSRLKNGPIAIQVQSVDSDGPIVMGIRWFRKVAVSEVIRRTIGGVRAEDPPIRRPMWSGVCPFSRRVITCPVRGVNCAHWQCFDLLPWVIDGDNTGNWKCPICHLPIKADELRFDPGFLLNVSV